MPPRDTYVTDVMLAHIDESSRQFSSLLRVLSVTGDIPLSKITPRYEAYLRRALVKSGIRPSAVHRYILHLRKCADLADSSHS